MGCHLWVHTESDTTEVTLQQQQQVNSFGSRRVWGAKKQKPEEMVLGPELVAQTVKNLPAMQETWVQSLVVKIPQKREREPIPTFLPGEFHR